MRVGIVEMMPGDFRTWTKDHTRAVRNLGFTGIGFHLDSETAFEITPDDCRRYHEFMAGEGLDLAQFAILYGECLFSSDTAERHYNDQTLAVVAVESYRSPNHEKPHQWYVAYLGSITPPED